MNKIIKSPYDNNNLGKTIKVPILGYIPCGAPFLAEENKVKFFIILNLLWREEKQHQKIPELFQKQSINRFMLIGKREGKFNDSKNSSISFCL